jgi:RNA polymerase-associated protein LEO1
VRDASGAVRKDAAGKPLMESNARFVQWSDGSWQLRVGEEVFDVKRNPLLNQFAFSMTADTAPEPERPCMQAQCMLDETLQFRPLTTSSAAHKELELKVKRQMVKQVRLKTLAVSRDPTLEQDERMRAIEGRHRLQQRQRSRGGEGAAGKRRKLDQDFLEASDEERGGARAKRAKKKTMAAKASDVFGDDDDLDESSADSASSDEDERARKRRQAAAKSKKESEEEEDEEEDEDEEDEDSSSEDESDDSKAKGKAKGKAPLKKKKVVDSESD